MKKIITISILLFTFSTQAQWFYNANGTGVQTLTNFASGTKSTAMGLNTTASGENSTAMGEETTASGINSTAMGLNTTAWGTNSTAMGQITTASGSYSTSMGLGTNTQFYGQVTMGVYNIQQTPTPNPNVFYPTGKAFVIGNGTSPAEQSDAFVVRFNGNTTIAGNVTAPAFIGDGSLLTNLPDTSTGLEELTEGGNYGWRLKGRYPANYGDIGDNAVDLSYSIAASNTYGATGPYSFATGLNNTASGGSSTAMGSGTNASGNFSTAMGFNTEASGWISRAMGMETIASGYNSTSMGWITEASGSSSTAMGRGTTASDFGSLTMGTYNTLQTTNANDFDLANRALVIGNGTAVGSESDALTVLFDGTTTIAGNVTAPAFIGDGSQLTNVLDTSTGLEEITEGGNTGWRMKGRLPFRYGDIGNNAIDLSKNILVSNTAGATGSYSTAMGFETTASGQYSTAMGRGTTASGLLSTTMGENTTASDFGSTAMGSETTASGPWSTAMGSLTTASGGGSTTMGRHTTASGNYSLAMGFDTTASGTYSTASGEQTTASGVNSTAMGRGTTASDYGSLTLGSHNTLQTTNATAFDLANRALVIGNGTFGSESDALTVLFDGTTTIVGNVTAPAFIGDGSLLTNLPDTGTDDQQLTLSGNNLELENGGTVDLSGYLDNTDSQNISGSGLAGTNLTIGIEGGTSETIDLTPLIANLIAQNEAQQVLIDDLIERMEIREQCECNGPLGVDDSNLPRNQVYLSQNVPNPFNHTTTIGYFIPFMYSKANIVISTTTGQILQNIAISKFGEGSIEVNKDRMASGMYFYTLFVDGKKVDTKRMIIE